MPHRARTVLAAFDETQGPPPAPPVPPLGRRPLHERFPPFGWLRRPVRALALRVLRGLADSDAGRDLALRMVRGAAEPPAGAAVPNLSAPYADLALPPADLTRRRADPVFITGRFRSGSTLLWNLFRHAPGFTSYYEPLNERRWFDPASRGSRVDPTHKLVEDYWKEYEGLEVLKGYYRDGFYLRDLFLDAGAWAPDLQRYIEILIERAPARPALQFNRVDFRLPWLRATFPHAKIVHLHRHPRDQWMSALVDPAAYPRTASMADFARHDHFSLLWWTRDLVRAFPFLDESACSHAYGLYYLVWKLSYLFGKRHAHLSIAYEDLLARPHEELARVFGAVDAGNVDPAELAKLIVKPTLGRWRDYASDDWFRAHEARAEGILAQQQPAAGLPTP